jgi:hypothetical protein
MSMLEKRVISTEMEFGAGYRSINGGSQMPFSYEILAEILSPAYLPPGVIQMGGYLANGSRLYQDHLHPEHSLPEVTSLQDLLVRELGSEKLVRDTFENWEDTVADRWKVVINKRVSNLEEAWGYHVNIQSLRETWGGAWYDRSRLRDHPAFKMLGLQLATANMLVGSGGIHGKPATGYQFTLAQKAMYLNCDFDEDTVHQKPVINLRDEPLADPSRFVRLHITSQDANLSPWASLMKWGMSVLLVSCAEEKLFPRWDFDLQDNDLLRLAKHTATDLTCKETFRFECGYRTTALEIQEKLYEAAHELSRRIRLPDELLWVLGEWKQAITDVQQDPELLADRADWVQRRRAIGRQLLIHTEPDKNGGVGLGHLSVQAADLAFDRLTTRNKDKHGEPRSDMPTLLRTRVWEGRYMPSQEDIYRTMLEAPADTRAGLRGEYIQRLHMRPEVRVSHWNYGSMLLGNSIGILQFPDDPRQSQMPGFDQLIDAMLQAETIQDLPQSMREARRPSYNSPF